MAAIGIPTARTFLARVCAYLGQPSRNLAIPGSSAQDTAAEEVAAAPRDAATQFSFVWWGLNDLGAFGPRLEGFKASMRFLISRLRSRHQDIHGSRDPAFSFRGNWRDLSGIRMSTADAGFTWRSPRGFAGGTVAFLFTFGQGYAARYAFSIDGRPAGGLDTASLASPPPASPVASAGAIRLRIPPGGGHRVDCAITGVVRGATIAGWELESSRPPLVVLLDHYRLKSYAPYKDRPFEPTDAQVLALNRAIRSVARDYGSYVTVVDTDAAFAKKPSLLFPDGLHPNAKGQLVLAGLIERALRRNPHVRWRSP
jgi:lysophospholipase L1-like esterase